MGSPDSELSVLLLDDTAMAGLNQHYLNREGPTNVIAFPMTEGEFSGITPGLLGDVVISLDTAAREAEAVELSISSRFKELLIHGMLHLFGYDHVAEEARARRMEEKSRELFEKVRPLDMEITASK